MGSTGNGTCKCDKDYFGSYCNISCSATYCQDTELLYHPSCTYTGVCKCQNDTDGYWVGDKCNLCELSQLQHSLCMQWQRRL